MPTFGNGLSGYIFTAVAIIWQLKKPVLAGCVGCFGSIFGASDFYQSCFGFSPLREFWLAYDNHQTWDQAKLHFLNPTKYSNSSLLPFLQDILNDQQKELDLLREEYMLLKNELMARVLQKEIMAQLNEPINKKK